ncbi:MAG TPA: hypothetical protein VMV69_21155 [Pirellulales bacterium]|nr:hypothetical protein [Pirellulales bacterium]
MNQVVIVDPATVVQLRGVVDILELRDAAGNILGHFMPSLKGTDIPGMQPQISEEELTRREAQGGGRRLTEILAGLESMS